MQCDSNTAAKGSPISDVKEDETPCLIAQVNELPSFFVPRESMASCRGVDSITHRSSVSMSVRYEWFLSKRCIWESI